MTKKIQRAEDAYQIHQNIVDAKKNLMGNFLRLAYLLKVANEKKIYKDLGYENWEQYISTPEISVSISTASRLVNIWKEFVIRFQIKTAQLSEIDLSKLFEILPLVRQFKSIEQVNEWLLKAKELAVNDLRIVKKEYLTGNTTEDCKHEFVCVTYWRCNKCGLITKINPE